MHAHEAAGIAAPQIGEPLSIFALSGEITEGLGDLVLINPKVAVDGDSPVERGQEGCLSFPGVSAFINRHTRCGVVALSPEGEDITLSAEGFLARAVQHEFDHVNGILMTDLVSWLQADKIKKKVRKFAKKLGR